MIDSHELNVTPQRTVVMDATRTSDGTIVTLKIVKHPEQTQERNIIDYFSGDSLKTSSNHAVPVYHVLQSPIDPNVILIVMPYLIRIDAVKFATVGEVLECLDQLFEVCQFVHIR